MAKTKQDKSRKQNLENYKKSKKQKTMAQAPEMKPFRQIPTWESNDKFEIVGSELEALYNYFNIVAPAFTAVQQIFARGIQESKIKIGYEYEDGTPVPDEEVTAYTQKLNEYFKELKAVKDEQAEAPTSVILDENGAPATSE